MDFSLLAMPSLGRNDLLKYFFSSIYKYSMLISLVAAASANNVIGKNNQLLWHLPNDLKFFKNTTWGMPVIMGRKTFESVNQQPLRGRFNIVISRSPQVIETYPNLKAAFSLQQSIAIAGTTDAKEVFIVGGGQIYEEALPIANRIYLTRVHAYLEGDVFFPAINPGDWKQIANTDFRADEKHLYAYSFQIWERK
jgi:dihydrofolate reductase